MRGLFLAAALAAAVPAHAQQTHLLVITGLGGDPVYTEQFHGWATTLVTAATERYGLPAENVTYLGEKIDLDPDMIADRSTMENVTAAIETLAERADPADQVAIVIFGHGSFTDRARINLPRRDPSAEDFAPLLDRLGRRRVTFVNTASASGPFLEALSGEGRVVMTATRTAASGTPPSSGATSSRRSPAARMRPIRTATSGCRCWRRSCTRASAWWMPSRPRERC